MSQGTLFYYYALGALSVLYLLVCVLFFQNKSQLPGRRDILAALSLWPLCLIDEWARVLDLQWYAYGISIFDAIAVVVLTFVVRAIRPLLVLDSPRSVMIWGPAIVCALCSLPLLLVDADTKLLWFTQSQVGQPLLYWPFYLPALTAAFGLLLLGVVLAEDIHKYHFYLPSQTVDCRAFRIKRFGGLAGLTVGIAFTLILLLCAVTFGFFTVTFWQSLYHLLIATVTLALLACVVYPQRTSPSPLDYKRLQHSEDVPATLQTSLDRAKLDMIEHKAYKQRELTISEFCTASDIDPTTLALALQLEKHKTFRGFVYHYRLEYAKKVLLRSDASITRVAKRLGLESEQFLSGVLPSYLNER